VNSTINSCRKKRKKDSELHNNIKLDGPYLSLLEEKDSGETNRPCQHQAIPLPEKTQMDEMLCTSHGYDIVACWMKWVDERRRLCHYLPYCRCCSNNGVTVPVCQIEWYGNKRQGSHIR